MKELAPEDEDVIEEFIKAMHRFTHIDMPVEKAPELYSPIDGFKIMLKMLPYLPLMKKWGGTSIQDF
ncbi:MAG: hypothetical protein GTO40_11255, partial [Deltaproteobacteria bacterium]|nr:hypothetical protein [Deltaproteobacteria bacterium]